MLVLPTWYFWVSVLGVKLPLRFIKLSFARWLLIDMLPTVRFWSPFCEEAVTFFEACFEWLDELSAFCLAFDVFLATGFGKNVPNTNARRATIKYLINKVFIVITFTLS